MSTTLTSPESAFVPHQLYNKIYLDWTKEEQKIFARLLFSFSCYLVSKLAPLLFL